VQSWSFCFAGAILKDERCTNDANRTTILNMKYLTKQKWILINIALLLLLLLTIVIAVNIGGQKIDLLKVFKDYGSKDSAIFFTSRLPRVLLAGLVGLSLASSGGAYQSLLRNPLADPYILGVSGGAALGSVIAVGLGLPFIGTSILSFIFSLISMFLIFAIAKTKGRLPSHTLLLTGVIFNAFCFAIILFINSIVTMEQAYQIIFLLIGNIGAISYNSLLSASILILAGFLMLTFLGKNINVLTLGDEEAMHLGVNSNRLRIMVFFASSLMVGTSVALSGLIGFVGLFIPHIVRLVFGPDNRLLIPASGFFGAIFLIISDTISRTILINTTFSTELPVGVITALIGAPVFMFLLKKQQVFI